MKKISLLLALCFSFSVQAAGLTERQKQFQLQIEKAKTPEGQIKKAEMLAKDPKSTYRIDAVNYLTDHHVKSSAPLLVELMKDPAVREFAIYGVGELQIFESTPLLIQYMKDDNRNVRGNAYRALQKMYPREFMFEFHHDDNELSRKKVIQNIENWWAINRDEFKNRKLQEVSEADKKEAEARWEKYGKDYLQR